MKPSTYYKILRCINTSRTMEHLTTCERMINLLPQSYRYAGDLANLVLMLKINLLTKQYKTYE